MNASDAILQRIIHLMFDCSGHTAASKEAADELATLPVAHVSHWLVMACQAEARVVDTVRNRAPLHEAALLADPAIRSHRIAKNHGQLMALAEALAALTDMPHAWRQDVLETLRTAATQRQDAIASDHPVVEEFWDLIDFLGLDMLNHARRSDELIALNLNQVIKMASQNGQPMPPSVDLKRHLKGSRSRKFLGIKTVNSGLHTFEGRSVKCWCFEPPRRH